MKLLITAVLALIVAGCSASEETGFFNKAGFIAKISTEAQIGQATVTSTGNIYLTMVDNGNARKGYAMYVCEVARDFASGELNAKLVKVLDQNTISGDSKPRELGRYLCKFK
jgi:hypothetical protein